MSEDTKITPNLKLMGMVAEVNCKTLKYVDPKTNKMDDNAPDMLRMRELAAKHKIPFDVKCSDQVFGGTPAVIKIDSHRDPQIETLKRELDNSNTLYKGRTLEDQAKRSAPSQTMDLLMQRFDYDNAVAIAVSNASGALSASGVGEVLEQRQKDVNPSTMGMPAARVMDRPTPTPTPVKAASLKDTASLKR